MSQDFKINNNWFPFYSRLFEHDHPNYRGFFRLRTLKPGDATKRRWWKWHLSNPKVYELFKKFTLEAIRAGHKRYSAHAIVQRIRWHTDIETRKAI